MPPDTITAKELADIVGKGARAINKQANREAWPSRRLNGRGDKAYVIDSLPPDIQAAISAHRAHEALPIPAPPIPSPSRGRLEIAPTVATLQLSPSRQEEALAKADLIRLYTAALGGWGSKDKNRQRFMEAYNSGLAYPSLYNKVGPCSWQTIERWKRDLRESRDAFTLADRRGAWKRDMCVMSEDERNILLSCALHPNRPRISEAIRMATSIMHTRGVQNGRSEATYRRYIDQWRKLNYDKWVFCREGEKALNDKCLPYMERDIGLLDVGDVLVADGHVLNFDILHPFTGKPGRMIMIAWYDWASCYPAGLEIMPTENMQCVAAGLRRAILTIGKMPKVAYLDNGKAFKARLFTSQDVDFVEAGYYGMFARLGIEAVFAWPYHAQSKPVERFFGTFAELERLMSTYTGTSIENKPAHVLRNERLHKAVHEKRYGGWVPTISEALTIIHGWVADYAKRPHAGLKGLCPGEVLAAGKGPGIDEAALRFLMMHMEIKTVGRNGVRFMGRHYYDEALYGFRDRVLIRYDLEDLSRIYVYDATGSQFICEALPVQAVHPMARLTGLPEDRALIQEGIKQARHLKKGTEAVARAYVEEAPRLVALPERVSSGSREQGAGSREQGAEERALDSGLRRNDGKVRRLPRGEAERIEAEAAKMKVIELKPRQPEVVYVTESDRYEALLERECNGESLALDDMAYMRYFEKTDTYAKLKERFEFLRELYLVGPEEAEEGESI